MIEMSHNTFYVPRTRFRHFFKKVVEKNLATPEEVREFVRSSSTPLATGNSRWAYGTLPEKMKTWSFGPYNAYIQTEDLNSVAPLFDLLSPWAKMRIMAAGQEFSRYELMRELKAQISLKDFVPSDKALDDHQIETILYTLTDKDTIVGDDPGTGKTISLIVTANALAARRILIICPSSAKYNWAQHMLEWGVPSFSREDIVVYEGRDGWRFSRDIKRDKYGPVVDIINFDILSSHKAYLSRSYDLIICDEAHRLQNEGTLRTAAVLGGQVKGNAHDQRMSSLKALRRVFATGTPADKPIQLWPLLRSLDPKGLGADYEKFIVKYCGAFRDPLSLQWVCNGATNLPELKHRLGQTLMVRHTNKVLNLPPVTEETFVMRPPAALLNVESQMVYDIVSRLTAAKTDDNATPPAPLAPLTPAEEAKWKEAIGTAVIDQTKDINGVVVQMSEMSTYRKKMAEAKAPEAARFVVDLHRIHGDEPIVVFGWHKKEMIKAIATKLKRYGRVETITGDNTAEEKYEITQKLQRGEVDFLVANMAAAGEALTMTRSRLIAIVEWDWSAKTMTQVIMRVARRGQTRPVNVYYLVFEDTIEGNIVNVARRKMTTQKVLFGDEDEEAA